MKETFKKLQGEVMSLKSMIDMSLSPASDVKKYLAPMKFSPQKKSLKINEYLLNDIYNLADYHGKLAECVWNVVDSVKILDYFLKKIILLM